jgi:hypothetical protein
MSLDVFTVTGVPRREPWRPYGRIVSPERELQLLSVDPWRPMDSGFLVIVTALSYSALQDAMRLHVAGGWVGGGGLLAQKGLGRLLHRGGTRCRCAHGRRTMRVRLRM